MSGYLRWLAQRALGPASGLRPARRPRSFASGPSHGSDGAAAFAETARPRDFSAAERQFDAPSRDRTGAARSDAMPATPLTFAAPPAAAQAYTPAAAAQTDTPATAAQAYTPAAAAQAYAPAAVAQADAPAAAAQPDAPALATAAQDTDAPAPQARGDAARRVEHVDRSGVDDRPRRAGSEIADGNTSHVSDRGLIPRPALAPRMATRPARNRPPGDPSDRRRETSPAPDVHIHIGRVELTAVTSAAPARRESAANSKKPMSLEEYLRRRSGRPS
jgi:hypothetical protein